MIDFNKYNKSTQSNSSSGASPVAPVTTTKKGNIDFNKFGKAGAAVSTAPAIEEKKPWAKDMVKGLVTAPATMIARPLQLGYELIMPGDNTAEMDKFSKEKLGGIVAPVPTGMADVKKDVGRGIETVALGMSPIAGGAAFGVGGSLEQGNDLFSVQTLLQGTVGALAGKVIQYAGKPLLDATGKVIGTVTPKILKDLALKGAGAVEKFMANQELLGGIAKPLSEKITAGGQVVDTAVDKLFKGGKGKLGNLISEQYPGLSKDAMTKRFEKIEQDNLMKPTRSKGFDKATQIYNDAKTRKIDLGKASTDRKIYDKDLVQDGFYDTTETVQVIRGETASKGPDIIRPALEEAEAGVQRVPVSEIREQMIAEIEAIPNSKITPSDRKKLLNSIEREYGDVSASSTSHPDGYNLTDLYDSKIASGKKVTRGGFAAPLNAPTKTANTYYKTQAKVFRDILGKKAPKEIGFDAFEKKLEEGFLLADYLEALHKKKAPQSLFKGAMRTGAKVAGASLGGSTGNVFGAFGGYHAGGMAMDSFMNASNPVKAAYLKEVQATEPEIFNAIREYIGDQQTARLMRLQLPAGSPKAVPGLMRMQNERGAVEMGYIPKDITPEQRMSNDFNQNKRLFGNTKALPAPEPRTIVPNTQGTPNQPGVDYGTPEVGGMRQRIFKGGGTVKDGSILVKDFTNRGISITPSIKEEIKNQNFILKKTSIDDILKKDLDLKEFVDNFKGTTKKTTEPIIIGNWQGKDNSVMDGWHRIAALKNSGVKEVDAYISTGLKRIDFTQPASFSKFKTPGKKFMITTTDNPMGKARPDHINAQEMTKFRNFLDDNNIHYTPQRGKYGGNPENSNIIEIDNPQQQAIIDRYLQATNPQAENIIVSGDRAVRYDPRTKEAYQVSIKGKSLDVDPEADDFFSEVAGKKYSFPLYGDSETPLSIDEFNKLYNR